ncbi:MAG: DUF3500 domain-containing protein [Planctomycetota bacterium]|nr:DUF3500 domain-containing protein [Planctomycetota bacterium]
MLNEQRPGEQSAYTMKPRRDFLRMAGVVALTATGLPLISADACAASTAFPQAKKTPETLVKVLFDSLTAMQRTKICFDWNHVDKDRGLLRTRLENNWTITEPAIKSNFYSSDQQHIIREIFDGMTDPGWRERWDRQLKDDVGGFGNHQSIAIFGNPGTDKFEFVLASRHMTLRCDGKSAEHVAFGGPILYAHEGEDLYEKPSHPSNVFWHQALAANKLYDMFDGKQRKQALVIEGMPSEELVGFRGPDGKFDGLAVTGFSSDQKEHLQSVLQLLVEPFRKSDQDEVTRCLKVQGGLDACRLAFYKEGDLGSDGIWDNWRLEGPSFVWYFRGKPHVHVWVNVADRHDIELNSYQDSIGV